MTLRPVQDTDAEGDTGRIFQEAKSLLGVQSVPLMLRYLANAPGYLRYLWEPMRQDLGAEEFHELSQKLISFSLSSAAIIYTPSHHASEFAGTMSREERVESERVLQKVLLLQSVFFLFSLDLREDLKTAFSKRMRSDSLPVGEDLIEGEGGDPRSYLATESMEAPFFQNGQSVAPGMETLFTVVAKEMERLGKTEAYLKTRVELERVGLLYLASVPSRMHSNYKVFMERIEDEYVAYELLYLLTHVFPSDFPHLLLTGAAMHVLLHGGKHITIR
ncbi:MAG: hypothetical protein RLZZ455_349 [Candidatus Parcubacteria bacterium]|jgi:hypothetical protein